MTKRFYFAWINEGEAFNPAVHNREDESVFSFKLDQSEGDFAGLEITLKNPRIGLLNTGRKQWVWFSFDNNGTIVPLFKGRLVSIPTNVFDTLVTLDFTARPSNFVTQKLALAHTMKVAPYWDPIFVSPDSWSDPDAVLEAYSKLWHIDPVTHVVTVSDVIVGEDGVEEVQESEHFYDNMGLTLNQTPLRRVSMVATIPWTQSSLGAVDLTRRVENLFGTPIPTSFTMQGLIGSWPQSGSQFGSGWQVISGSMTDVSYSIEKAVIPDIFSWQGTVPDLPIGSIVFPLKVTGEYHSGEKAGYNFQYELVIAALNYAKPDLQVTYTANREFAQVVTFTLETNQQAIVTLPGEDEAMLITLNANKVSDPTEGGSVPIGNVARRDFIHTTRGLSAVEHLLLIARSHLISRSRCVETTFQVGFVEGLRLLSLRKNSLLHDHRLPGGQASGKNIKYEATLNGDNGAAVIAVTFASCVGYGGSYSTSTGTPTYVDSGYMDDTQEYHGQVVVTDTADIAWTIPDVVNFDDGIDFIRGLNDINSVISASIVNTAASQAVQINAASDGPNTDQSKISSVLQEIPTMLTFHMVPMEGGPFQHEVVVSVSNLIVPQQINLEAPSNA